MNIRTFKKKIIKENCVVFIPFFIRWETRNDSHWLLFMIDQRNINTEIFVVDSFDCYFNQIKVHYLINSTIRSFPTDSIEETVVTIVKPIEQKTNFECGYRVIKMVDFVVVNDVSIDSL